jgi:hypothetical protein
MRAQTLLVLIMTVALTLPCVIRGTAMAGPTRSEDVEGAMSAAVPDEQVPADDSRGSIRVRGHWVIEVHDPDGGLVTRREFDNALTTTGQDLLSLYLGRAQAPGLWQIRLLGTPAPCTITPGVGAPYPGCFLMEARPGISTTQPGLTRNLVVTSEPLKLAGSISVIQAGQISNVATFSDSCGAAPSALAPTATCIGVYLATPYAFNGFFTATDITPISLLAGQLVTVSVTITFSSAP